MKRYNSSFLTIFLCFFLVKNTFSQGSIIPLGNDAYHILDRLEIKTGVPFSLGTGLKPYLRGEVIHYATDLDTSRLLLSGKDRKDLFWLFKDSNEWLSQSENPTTLGGKNEKVSYENDDNITKLGSQSEASRFNRKFIERTPILKYFYKTPANFFQMDSKNIYIRANPIFNVKYFKDAKDDKTQFFNQRGLELRGGIDDKVFFYANVLETQANFAAYVRDRVVRDSTLPGANLLREYVSSVGKLSGYDYSIANGYVGFNLTKHIGFQFGHGNSFIGDGIRSLIFSDFSPNHLYFKFNTRFGKFQYQNLFTEMRTTPFLKDDTYAPKKHLATHFFNYNITKNLNFGVFESIVYGNRPGSGWDINYFNPIIFYRSVEYLGNSADNALLGAQGKWNFLNRFSLYGQFLLDEFNFGLLFPKGNTPKGWWGNKYGIQTGLKYIDVLGIDHFDAQLEYNMVRPFTYSHETYFTNYANSNQPIAHPIGANFNEKIIHLRYQPTPKFVIETRFVKIKTGEDSTLTKSYGQNVVRPYTLKAADFGTFVGQGAKTDISMLSVDLSYQFFHNMYADLHYFYRKQKSDLAARNQMTNYIGGGIRINIANRRNEF